MISSKSRRVHALSREEQEEIRHENRVAESMDLTTEILSRLPPKSLFRFKCVCKDWSSLVSDPFFAKSHTLSNPHPVSGLLLQPPSNRIGNQNCVIEDFDFIPISGGAASAVPDPSLSFLKDPSGIFVWDSQDGLLVCSSLRGSENDRVFYICNPTTREFSVLPKPRGNSIKCMNLVFDSSKSEHYKLVCVRQLSYLSLYYQIDVYSSETGNWRLSGEPFTAPIGTFFFHSGVICNGKVNWMAPGASSLCFDIEREEIRAMPLPPKPSESDRNCIYFGQSGGKLYWVEKKEMGLEIFEMEEDYSKWLLKWKIESRVKSIFGNVKKIAEGESISSLFYFHREEDLLVLYSPGKIISYNLQDKTLKKVCELQITSRDYKWYHVYPCTNTLFPLHSDFCSSK